MKAICKHTTLLIFYIFSILSFAQSLSTKHFTNNDGLSLSENLCLFQDSRRFIWIGSNGSGVDMYNGKSFINYNKDNGLHDIVVKSIDEDAQGSVWFASPSNGLCSYDGHKFKQYNHQGLASTKINKLIKTPQKNLLALTENGIIEVKNETLSQLKCKGSYDLKENYLDAMFSDNNKLVIYTSNKLIFGNYKAGEYTYLKAISTEFAIAKVIKHDANTLSICARNGNIYNYNLTTETLEFKISINKFNNNYQSIDVFEKWNNTYLAGSYGNGIFIIQKNLTEIKNFKISEFKESNFIISDILIDYNNNLWISTFGDGLLYLKSSSIQTFSDGLPSQSDIFHIGKSNDLLLVTSYESGIFSVDKTGKEKLLIPQNNPADYIGLKTLSNGETYGFAQKKLFKFNNAEAKMQPVNVNLHPNDLSIMDIHLTPSGKLILISTYAIYDITNLKAPTILYKCNNEKDKLIVASLVDKKNNIWFSLGASNYILKSNGYLEEFKKMNERCGETILNFIEDNAGNIWMVTNQCLAKYNGTALELVDNKILYNKLYYSGLYSKSQNAIWLGTSSGILQVKLSNNFDISEVELYDSKAGFTAKECNQNAIYEDTNKVWFGTLKGIVGVDKNNNTGDTTMPKLGIIDLRTLLSDIEIKSKSSGYSKWFNIPENLELPYNKNHITIGFTGIQYINPEKIKYRYKLIGYDTGYSIPTSYNYASYTNLPPGKYTLQVIANNSKGDWTKEPLEFSFNIERPYWKTWWFYIIISFSIFSISSLYYYYRKRQVVILEKRLEEEVAKRTYELKKQNDKIEILMKEIHHRVKNNLQVITSLINLHSGFVDDPKALEVFRESKNRIKSMALVHEKLYETNDLSSIMVEDFIVKMFDYLRDIYDNSKASTLQKSISIKKLDIDTIIPLGLLINEIFTNAFKYGLKNSESKVISIEMHYLTNKRMGLIIKDSGKGFDYELKRKSKSSFGLELIELLVSQLNGKVKVDARLNTTYDIQFESIGKSTAN